MLYSPERSSLAGTAPTGSVLLQIIILPAGVHSGKSHTLQGEKDENGSSMGRGYKSIGTLKALLLRTSPLLLLCSLAATRPAMAQGQAPETKAEKGSAKSWDKKGQAAEAHQD